MILSQKGLTFKKSILHFYLAQKPKQKMPKHAPDVDKRGSESFHRPGKIRIPHLNRMVSIKGIVHLSL